jgi:tetratricopeptide (TPR) repeat protein
MLAVSCTTKKNTFIHRGYHNMTARFNGYYYSTESIDEGIFKLERANKDDYNKTLPVFIYPTNETAKNTNAEFDRAIKKSSTCIQRHTIKDKKNQEITSAGKWIDNNWINIGKSHFYKREFFSGIEAFDYVARSYQSKDKYTALLWLAKSYNEVGAVSQSEPIISLLKNEKKLPKKIRNQLYAVEADYHVRRGLYTEAMTDLGYCMRQSGIFTGIKKSKRARYAFITAQLAELQKDERKARKFYEKTIRMKPGYEMTLYAKIKLARLYDVRNEGIEKIKRELLAMTREEKNNDFLDIIYYTLGEISERQHNTYQALSYYQKSVAKSTSNLNQKAHGYLKLGEINFDLTNYPIAGAYYDSAVATLPKEHLEYDQIVARKKTLEKLVGYITTIKTEDSLQRISKLSDKEIDLLVENMIRKQEEEEERKKEEAELALNNNQLNSTTLQSGNDRAIDAGNERGAWYFYNPTAVAFGVGDFQRKWGNRKQEDDWRRAAKALTIDEIATQKKDSSSTVANNINNGGTPQNKNDNFKKQFKSKLPTNDSLLAISNGKIIDAYYSLGSTYKEDLNNNKKSIEAFEELNKRYTTNKFQLSSYYQLYRIYLADKKQEKSDFYKDKILTEFPTSEYAKLIQNPKYGEELSVNKSEVEKNYIEVYQLFAAGNYADAYTQSSSSLNKFGKSDFTPKYEFIKALSIGKIKSIDTMEMALKQLVAVYPKSEVTPKANDILMAIKKQKHPELFNEFNPKGIAPSVTDTFKVSMDTEHFVLIITPDDPQMANDMKNRIDRFNTEYYSNRQFSINSNLFGDDKQMIVVKAFTNAKEAHDYISALNTDSKHIEGQIKKLGLPVLNMSAQNMPFFFRKRNVSTYFQFYAENYLSVLNSNKKGD